ncbi:hypothetical protein QQ056_17560 [Oscillatoria laete-virens NRMC-F 0139]|nr:hypothetical protein [Oscillatoria laete-virens]MDL5055342.1 hypothetical protein [Oscillatoria laete-virens NRMC-F 0139]
MMKAPKDGAVCALAGFFEILHQPDHPEVQKLRDLHKNLQKLLVMENGKD